MRICVTGAAGFIGGHLCNYLKERDHWVRGVDIVEREEGFSPVNADEFLLRDLRRQGDALEVTRGVQWVFGLAADMGGMGFISANQSRIARNNALANINTLDASIRNGVLRYLFPSSACIYPDFLQEEETEPVNLKEADAWPADPQGMYGQEKLYFEGVCQAYNAERSIETRTVRFHNIYGPQGTWQGGREKAPAALCRKVAEAKLTGNPEVEIWGDGEQTRSFMYIHDCLRGLYDLMRSDYSGPVNLGDDRAVSINELVDIIAEAAGIEVVKKHVDGPQGVRGRNADVSLAKDVLGWRPSVSLEEGIAQTYAWIEGLIWQSLHRG